MGSKRLTPTSGKNSLKMFVVVFIYVISIYRLDNIQWWPKVLY